MKRTHNRKRKLQFETCEFRMLLATVDLVPAADSTLFENDSGLVGNGGGEHFFAGRTNENSDSLRRGVIRFDLAAAIPNGAVINSANLKLNVSLNNPGSAVSLHRITSGWTEGTSDASGEEGRGAVAQSGDVTWIHTSFSTSEWQSPGGDFSTDVSATQLIDGTGEFSWSGSQLTADVANWLAEPGTNFGWLLRGDESTSRTAHRFDSRENQDVNLRPKLTIDYSIPNAPPSDIALSSVQTPSGATGAFIGNLTVVDNDSPANHILSVSDNRFVIESGKLRLANGQLLDRNVSPQVTLEITATDSDLQSRTEEFTIEVLEVTTAFQNPVNRFDINVDGSVSPLDALVLINFINSRVGDSSLPATLSDPPRFLNPNGDNSVAAIDVLLVVNFINANLSQGAGELLSEADAWSNSLRDVTSELDSPSENASKDDDVMLWDWGVESRDSRTSL